MITIPGQLFVLRPSRDDDASRSARDESRMAWRQHWCLTYGWVPKYRESPLAVTDLPMTGANFIWTWMGDLLADETAKTAFTEARISGCCFRPAVTPIEPDGRLVPSIWEVETTGFAGFAKIDGGVDLTDWCDECGIYSYKFRESFSRLLDLEKWDGTDMFRMWPFSAIICTERVRDVVKLANLSGVALIPIEEFDAPNRGAAPGLPSERLTKAASDRLLADPDYILAVRKP